LDAHPFANSLDALGKIEKLLVGLAGAPKADVASLAAGAS